METKRTPLSREQIAIRLNPALCLITYPSVVSSMPTIGKQSIPGSRSTSSSRIGPFQIVSLPVLLLLLLPRGTFSRPGPAAYRHTRVLCPSAYILTVRASCVPQETRSLGPLQRHTTTHVLLMLALHPPRTRSSLCPYLLPTSSQGCSLASFGPPAQSFFAL